MSARPKFNLKKSKATKKPKFKPRERSVLDQEEDSSSTSKVFKTPMMSKKGSKGKDKPVKISKPNFSNSVFKKKTRGESSKREDKSPFGKSRPISKKKQGLGDINSNQSNSKPPKMNLKPNLRGSAKPNFKLNNNSLKGPSFKPKFTSGDGSNTGNSKNKGRNPFENESKYGQEEKRDGNRNNNKEEEEDDGFGFGDDGGDDDFEDFGQANDIGDLELDFEPAFNPTSSSTNRYNNKDQSGLGGGGGGGGYSQGEVQKREIYQPAKNKLEEQRQKVKAVHRVIELRVEKYDFLEMSASSHFQSYLGKLTDGSIKNSSEQTNEDNVSISIQTEGGKPADYGCQVPEMQLVSGKQDDKEAQDLRLELFLKDNSDLFQEILTFKEKTTIDTNNVCQLKIPYQLLTACKGVTLSEQCMLQEGKAHSFISTNVQTVKTIDKQNISFIIEYRNSSLLNLYFCKNTATSISYEPESSMIVVGDQFGLLHIYSLDKKDHAMSKTIGHVVYSSIGISQLISSKYHNSPIIDCIFYSQKEIYSLDQDGSMVYWQVKSQKGRLSLTALAQLEVSGSQMMRTSLVQNTMMVAKGDSFALFNRFINNETTLSFWDTPFSDGLVSSMYYGRLKVSFAGFSTGEVRIYLEEQNESIFKLTGFTSSKIMLCFLSNYSKQDPKTLKIHIFESLATINIINEKGELFIFDLEKDLKRPDKVIKVLPEGDMTLKQAVFDPEKLIVHLIYEKDKCYFYMCYEMRRFRKKVSKMTQLKDMNTNIVKLLKLSFVN